MKTLQEKIAVMQAALEGKQIEVRPLRDTIIGWMDQPNPEFNWGVYDYRVKPPPAKELWVNEYSHIQGGYLGLGYASEQEACLAEVKRRTGLRTAVLYREVLPEEK